MLLLNHTTQNNELMSHIMNKLGIYLPEPVNPTDITPPKQEALPIREKSLRNFIIHASQTTSSKPFENIKKPKPKGYRMYRYINENGCYNIFLAHTDNIYDICKSLNIRYHLHEGVFAMPDYIGSTRVDSAILEDIIANKPAFYTEDRIDDWRETTINGIHVIYNAACDSNKNQSITPENFIRARYLKAMMEQVCDKLNQDKSWDNIPKIYQDIHRLICEYKNQWLPEEKGQYEQTEHLTPKSKNTWVLITKINSPEFFRYPENKNKKTFDFIEIHIGIRARDSVANRDELITQCIKDIIRIGFQKIQNNRKFKNFGIPISFLKPTKYAITKANEIIITYELKTKANT